jgi:hypothetical protein
MLILNIQKDNLIKTFDNKINVVGEDLKQSINKNAKLSIALSIF